MTWYTCENCEEEFRVLTESSLAIECCPFCGGLLDTDSEDDDINYNFEDDE